MTKETKERYTAMDSKLRCAAALLVTTLAWSGTVHATDDSAKGAARELANQAKSDFDAGNFEEAGARFQRAYEIAKVPTLAVWAARALVKREKLVAASELYRQATLLAPNDLWVGNVQQEAQVDAEKELGELQPRLSRLCIRVEGAAASDVELAVDGAKMASTLVGIDLPADPGQRHIVGKRGAEVVEQTVDLAEGEHGKALLRFTATTPTITQRVQVGEVLASPTVAQASPPVPAPPPTATVPAPALEARYNGLTAPPSPPMTASTSAISSGGGAKRTWGWAVLGVGAAGLVAGAATGISVMSNSSLRTNCPSGTCDPSKVSNRSLDSYNHMRDVSTAGFIVGGVGTVVGATLLLWTPRSASKPGMALWMGPSSAGVKGAF